MTLRSVVWLFAVLGLGLIVCAEGVLRVRYHEQLKTQSYPMAYQSDARLGYRYTPNARTEICLPSICKRIEINENGYYGPSFAQKKPTGVYRIAVVSSSGAAGLWLDGDEPFPQKLEAMLNARGHATEVINFSIDGSHRTLAKLRQIDDEVLTYAPDLILLSVALPFSPVVLHREMYGRYIYVAGHSAQPATKIEATRSEAIRTIDQIDGSALARIYDASYIVRASALLYARRHDDALAIKIRSYRHPHLEQSRLNLPTLSMGASIERLITTRRRVEATGAKLALYFMGSGRKGALARRGLNQLSALGVPVLTLEIPREPSLTHTHDGHPSDLGHRVIATALIEQLDGGSAEQLDWPPPMRPSGGPEAFRE